MRQSVFAVNQRRLEVLTASNGSAGACIGRVAALRGSRAQVPAFIYKSCSALASISVRGWRFGTSQRKRIVAANPPANCATRNHGTSFGRMPAKGVAEASSNRHSGVCKRRRRCEPICRRDVSSHGKRDSACPQPRRPPNHCPQTQRCYEFAHRVLWKGTAESYFRLAGIRRSTITTSRHCPSSLACFL